MFDRETEEWLSRLIKALPFCLFLNFFPVHCLVFSFPLRSNISDTLNFQYPSSTIANLPLFDFIYIAPSPLIPNTNTTSTTISSADERITAICQ